MLTAESAPQTLWEPYIGHLLQPLRPLVLFGRDASLQPRCPDEHALYYSWRDTGVGKFMIFSPPQPSSSASSHPQELPAMRPFGNCEYCIFDTFAMGSSIQLLGRPLGGTK